MKALAYDEKIATVMVYTNSMLVRGDVVAKENVRVSIWLRTQGVPNYIHLHGAQVISFSGGVSKRSNDQLFGRNEQNKVIVFDKQHYHVGQQVKVRVTGCTPATLLGESVG